PLRGHVVDPHAAIGGQVAAHPFPVVVAERGPGNDREALLVEARHGAIALDAAAAGEHLGVGDAPPGAGGPAFAQPLLGTPPPPGPGSRAWRRSSRRRSRPRSGSRCARRRSPATSAAQPSRAGAGTRLRRRRSTRTS